MAVQAAPYLHAKLNAIAVSSTNGNGGNGGGDVNIVQIIAVPRGGRLDPKSGTITIDGELVTEPPNVEPYQPTPPLELTDQTEQPAPIEPPLPIPEVDTANVERLDAWRKRGDGEPGSSGGA